MLTCPKIIEAPYAMRAWSPLEETHARSRKARPAAVNSMPCTLRLISGTPTLYSRSRIWRLREGCAVWRLFGRDCQAARIGDRNEIAKVP
jgi:hypothetical protein